MHGIKPEFIAGVDEAGRGPLAGPVVAAAVILPAHHGIEGIDDSKKLSELTRMQLAKEIKEKSHCWCIAESDVAEIDELNILHATMQAMNRALAGLSAAPQLALIDGNRCPPAIAGSDLQMLAVVKGDSLHQCIGAASIIAKVHRDDLMKKAHEQYPQYGFNRHKGYPTKAHRTALLDHGPSEIHRRSFRPVAESLTKARSTAKSGAY